MMEENESTFISDAEWEKRTLCSDEGCIGVVGPDGRCGECGRLFEGELPAPAAGGNEPAAAPETAPEAPFPEEESADDDEDKEALVTDGEWEKRTLCSDEGCIGVIGPDGRCKECGRPLEGA